jgi:hypothetical protein
VGPGDLVAAVGPEQQQRLLLGRTGERRQQPEGGVVGLVQVVQEHRDRVAGGDPRQGGADGLEQRGAVAAGRGRAELGEQQRQMPRQRALDGQLAPPQTEIRPQRRHHRPVAAARLLDPDAFQDVQAGAVEHQPRQGGLAHPGLAGEQHQRTPAGPGRGHLRVELRPFGAAAQQLLAHPAGTIPRRFPDAPGRAAP